MERLYELINDLMGTYFSLEEGLERCNLNENDVSLEELDGRIFQCEECGVWYDSCEKVYVCDSVYCINCTKDLYDDE